MMHSRREFLKSSLLTAGSLLSVPVPSWATTGNAGLESRSYPGESELHIGPIDVVIDGRRAKATGINGSVPGPLLRFREGDQVSLRVHNALGHTSSLHWHGLMLPSNMDGVPGLSFAGIKPGQYYDYHFELVQNGTYWYHSHSGLQEQTGLYGPIIIDPLLEPTDADPLACDREFVILLSDWTFEDPERVFANLKKMDTYYNYQRRTLSDFVNDAKKMGLSATIDDRKMWGAMRMDATDIVDVGGATYTYLMNGLGPVDNWTGLFSPGERVRLRFINGSAMSIFNVRIPELEMTVVQADGVDIQPLTIDEFQIGTAETFDVIIRPQQRAAYTIFAESIDSSGYARGTLTADELLTAPIPDLRQRPLLTMTDMGMNHAGEDMHAMHHGGQMEVTTHAHKMGPGVASVSEMPRSRLREPGTGLADVTHRVLTYADLKGRNPAPGHRSPDRNLELHLTGNMERYMWSFDGLKFSEVDGPILVTQGERLRLILVNDTMMNHPIHLHGMFFELENGNGELNPLKHTLLVKPGERITAVINAHTPGDWAFHCHLLYHMKSGMMRTVRVLPPKLAQS